MRWEGCIFDRSEIILYMNFTCLCLERTLSPAHRHNHTFPKLIGVFELAKFVLKFTASEYSIFGKSLDG